MTPDDLKNIIEEAVSGRPELPLDLANFEGGFSSPRVRRLLNALCSLPDTNYLEIGVHTGSTFIPAVYGNTAQVTCIDHWRMFDSKPGFDKNVKRFIPERKINVIDHECFSVNLADIPSNVNVYFYDGDHGREAQYKAVTYFAPVLANEFVLIVDDCNWEEPREETKKALKDLGYTVLFEQLLPGAYNGDLIGWWNGLYVALVRK